MAASSGVRGRTIEIRHGGGNVYADLEFPNAEAIRAKAQLVAQLGQVI